MGGKKPYLVVILIQVIYAGMVLLMKAAFKGGMNTFVFLFYRQLVGTVCLVPLSLFFGRKNAAALTIGNICKIFMLALCGVTLSLNVYGIALDYTTATLGAAIANSLPVITFFFAVLLREENVNLKTITGIAKVAGMSVCMGGVATLAFYQGPNLRPYFHLQSLNNQNISSSQEHHHHADPVLSGKTWIKGCFLLFASNTSWGLWLVLQARFLKSYPSKLNFTCLQSLFSAIQSFVVAISLQRDLSRWKLGWNIRLLAIAYCGILVNGVIYYLQAWVIERKGPVFQAMSTPLCLLITTFCSVIFLGEAISLGSILGGILLVTSLYSVLWAKSKEQHMNVVEVSSPAPKPHGNQECVERQETEADKSRPPLMLV